MNRNKILKTFIYIGILLLSMVPVFHSLSAQSVESDISMTRDPLTELTISDIGFNQIRDDEVVVTFKTNKPSVSGVWYGEITGDENRLEYDSDYFVTSHGLVLTQLKSDTTYLFKVSAYESQAVKVYSDELSFTTSVNGSAGKPSPIHWELIGMSTLLNISVPTETMMVAALTGKIISSLNSATMMANPFFSVMVMPCSLCWTVRGIPPPSGLRIH